MPPELTPDEVEQATFTQTLRGYDKEEVEVFLAQIADQMRDLTDEARSAYQSLGEEMGELLQHARNSADEMVTDAQKKAREIKDHIDEELADRRRGAEEYAQGVREEAQEEARKIRSEAQAEARRIIDSAEERIRALHEEDIEARSRIQTLRIQLMELTARLEELERDKPEPLDHFALGDDSDEEDVDGSETIETERVDTGVIRLDSAGSERP